MGKSPLVRKNPLTDRRESEHKAQSTSQNPISWKEGDDIKKTYFGIISEIEKGMECSLHMTLLRALHVLAQSVTPRKFYVKDPNHPS